MTKPTNATQSTPGKAPDFIAYQVKDRPGKPGIFTRIGAAWAHRDCNGFNIELSALPLDGKIVLRTPAEETSE